LILHTAGGVFGTGAVFNDHSSIQAPAVSVSAGMIRRLSGSVRSRLTGYFSMAKVQLFEEKRE